MNGIIGPRFIGMVQAGEMLSWLPVRFDAVAIFLLAVADSSFLTIPEGNDLLIVYLAAGSSWRTMIYYVAVTVAGSVAGCILLFLLGRRGGSPFLMRRFPRSRVEEVERLFARYGIWTVLVPSILPPPCPFKIFVFSAGAFRLGIIRFLSAVVAGRTIRYSIWGILAVIYGNPLRQFMDRNLSRVGIALLLVLLLVLAWVMLRHVLVSRRAGS